MNEKPNNLRRKSLDPTKNNGNHRNESSFRIHLHSTKAVCRNQSFNTTDSLKLYENQIILKNSVLQEIDELSLQKRPLSLCFDLNSSGEEINTTDTSSSTMSSISSSSSSSSNSKSNGMLNSSGHISYDFDFESVCDDDPLQRSRGLAGFSGGPFEDEFVSEQLDYSSSDYSSAKESLVTVLSRKSSDPEIAHIPDRPYDLSSSDEVDSAKVEELLGNGGHGNSESKSRNSSFSEEDATSRELMEILKIFNEANSGMHMFEDENHKLRCIAKIFVNLSEPVKLATPSQLPNTSLVSSKTLLPRGGFELVNIDRGSTCRQMIDQIFATLQIQENYANYGIFEHTIREDDKVIVKRLGYDYCLMSHLLNMVRIENEKFTSLFQSRRFVLQESERVQINWSKFSLCELMNFLRILEKEERDRKDKIVDYYTNLDQMIRTQLLQKQQRETSQDPSDPCG